MNALLEYFDCDCLLGLPKVPLPGIEPDLNDLLSEMQRLGITRALIRHRGCLETSHEVGNQTLMDQIAGYEQLYPVWYVTPDGLEGEFDPASLVEVVLRAGVRATWTSVGGRDVPYLLDPWCAGELLGAQEKHRMPLLLPYGTLTPDTLHEVLSAYPHLPVILLEVPRLGRNHSLYRLMALHDNLVLCVSALYGVHLGLEDLCRNFGDQRLVFGSGYPMCEGGASITALTYANLQDDTKEAITHRNLWRILQEVQV